MDLQLSTADRETVEKNIPLVEHIVNRLVARFPATHSRDDLVQAGMMGLIDATRRFDPEAGRAFSTFAGHRIEGEIIDMLRRDDWAPRSVRALERRVREAEHSITSRTGSEPSRQALSKLLEVRPNQIDQSRRDLAQADIDSLDRPVSDAETSVPLSATVMSSMAPVHERLDNQEMLGYLRDAVKLLPERHRLVVVGFFFEGKSMTELGEILGVTQSRASQLKEEATRMMREGMLLQYEEQDLESGNEPMTAANDGKGPGSAKRPTRRQRTFNDSLTNASTWKGRLEKTPVI